MIKKADNVLNNNFLIRFFIPSLFLLFCLYPFLFNLQSSLSLPSEQKTKKPNPRTSSSPSTPKKIHGWALRAHLHCQHSKTQQVIDLLSPRRHRAVFCRRRVVVPNHSHSRLYSFLGFFFFLYSSPIGWRGVIFVAMGF